MPRSTPDRAASGGASNIPAQLAEQAADAVRDLIHETLGGRGYTFASDVETTLAELSRLAQMLPQALEQARQWVVARADEGGLRHDEKNVEDALPAELANLSLHLRDGAALAFDVAVSLDNARQITAHLTGGAA